MRCVLLNISTLGLILVLAQPAYAGGDGEIIFGSGPDQYRSREVSASVDLFDWPLILDGKHFLARNISGTVTNETTLGLSWVPSNWFLGGYHYTSSQSDTFDTVTHEYSTDFTPSKWWKGQRETRFSFVYGQTSYEANGGPVVRALLTPLLPHANRYSYGLTQEFSDQWSASFTYDDYRYSKDPESLARSLARRPRAPMNAVSSLTSFTDRSTSVGIKWRPTEQLSFDLSRQYSVTVIEQKLETRRLDARYRWTRNFQTGASAYRSTSTAIMRPNGTTLVESTGENYFELSARWIWD